ncbi:MAG TPA: transposase [Xanthobacteraceae bacterium]|nr:transposase [Xanthobacteraceae bacterium]
MNILPRDKQIEIIAALTEGCSIRAVERLCQVHRDSVMRLGARVGQGCAEFHYRTVLGLRVGRIELDECWGFVGKKQRRVTPKDQAAKGDFYTFIALASSSRAIVSYRVGKRNGETTDDFLADLRERVIGTPEISTDAWSPYQPSIRAQFGNRVAYGQINKTYSVTDLRKDAAHRYSPAAVVAVSREVISGTPAQISTSYVERQHLSLRTSQKRFARLTLGFSKKLEHHVAAVSLYVAHYNFCRVHETIKTTPAMALGLTDHVWSIGELLDKTLSLTPQAPITTAPDRRRQFRVIEGGRAN